MATLQMTWYSLAIARPTTFQLVLPNDVPEFMREGNPYFERPMKTLFLLHGYSGHCNDWMTNSIITELAGKYNLAVVMPSGDNSFYLNTAGSGYQYEDYITTELVQYIRKTFGLAMKPEDTFIGGLSMGGFGALHSGLAHPELYGKMFGLSSALIINDIDHLTREKAETLLCDFDYYRFVFGDMDHIKETDKDPEHIVKRRLAAGETLQPIYMACGTEDFLIENNRSFHDFLVKEGVAVTYKESEGIHDWKFWNEYIEPAILWALES